MRAIKTRGIFKQNGRAALTQNAITDLRHFQVWAYRHRDAFEFAHLLQLGNKVAQVVVNHGGSSDQRVEQNAGKHRRT